MGYRTHTNTIGNSNEVDEKKLLKQIKASNLDEIYNMVNNIPCLSLEARKIHSLMLNNL